MIARLVLAVLCCSLEAAFAAPARIIILRHGEKAGAWKFCGVGQATGFRMVKQVFDGRYAKLPSNDWGAPNGLTPDSDCDLKGAE
jgi:hypothetical protein